MAIPGYSSGQEAPSMLEREEGYRYKWLVNNKTYIQSFSGISNKGWVLEDGGSKVSSYKVYTALLTQAGGIKPEANVLENTLGGDITFVYGGDGNYTVVSDGLFTDTLTTVYTGQNYNDVGEEVTYAYTDTLNNIYIETFNGSTSAAENGILNNTFFEIRVYN